MNYYYITGTSRGIGKAIAEKLLQDDTNIVIGISRSSSISHKNYTHIHLDLSDLEKAKALQFEKHNQAKRLCLINNSGAIGAIQTLGTIDNADLINTLNINLLAPSILMNNFMKAYYLQQAEKIIVNVSSGAGKNPVDGWSIYCASKAGLDMVSRVADAEAKVKSKHNFKILSIAPGVVDTQMQTEIRNADSNYFSRKEEFIQYKNTGILADANAVADKYIKIINSADKINEVVISVKDY